MNGHQLLTLNVREPLTFSHDGQLFAAMVKTEFGEINLL